MAPPTAPRPTSLTPPVVGTVSTGRLIDLHVGDEAVLAAAEVSESERQLLRALGLVAGRRVRLRKEGSPWIVEVRGIRVGLAAAVAERLLVRPRAASGTPDEPSR